MEIDDLYAYRAIVQTMSFVYNDLFILCVCVRIYCHWLLYAYELIVAFLNHILLAFIIMPCDVPFARTGTANQYERHEWNASIVYSVQWFASQPIKSIVQPRNLAFILR